LTSKDNNEFDFSPFKSFYNVNSLKTLSSIWAKSGSIQIRAQEMLINVIVIIFILIVLVIIGIIVHKKIKDSSKQIGTLKALGVKNNTIASSYLIYPLVIVIFGFIISTILSFPIA